jgi:Mn2+/Fe2+ NRAMP family transporter
MSLIFCCILLGFVFFLVALFSYGASKLEKFICLLFSGISIFFLYQIFNLSNIRYLIS